MDQSSFGSFQQQISRNQAELTDYLKDLDSWKDSITQKDKNLSSSSKGSAGTASDPTEKSYPPIRNSLHKKKKKKIKKPKDEQPNEKKKPARIPGYDFKAWDRFDVDKALDDIDDKAHSSTSEEEETDEEWEEERMKQQAIFEKDQGNDYYKKDQLNEAISCYTRGIACDPSNAILYANRAMALLKQEKFGAVEQDCTDAIALDPMYIKAYMRRATARHKLNKQQAALNDYTRVLSLEPENKTAKREAAILKQELEISEAGLVIPIKKDISQRSKKPLLRIEIEDIDQEDVKLKLNAAISKTTQHQSSEKKRIVAKDEEMFSKYTNESPQATIVQSPADIKPLPMNKTIQKIPAKETSHTSPRTSPRTPANSYQFHQDWKTVKHDVDACYDYLKPIPVSDFPKLFGEFLDESVLKTILSILYSRFIRDGLDVLQPMKYLSQVKRFTMVIMFMSRDDKQDAKNILEHLATQENIPKAQLEELRKLYQL
ncbi:RNA polymerase II-associated protein 3-like [Watersipora subatra]|uniref:RNA polymerase II-associated protein 3-like n=1 Tax=Watersipora subatra TaxID=2589382 RepID=UPI00355C5C85